jgi:hypothetical protein
MGIFFKSQKTLPSVEEAIQDALSVNPQSVVNLKQEAGKRAGQVLTTQQFSWGRLAIALLLLIALFAAGIYSATHHLDDWSKVMTHSFELVLGLLIGLLGGEAAAQH